VRLELLLGLWYWQCQILTKGLRLSLRLRSRAISHCGYHQECPHVLPLKDINSTSLHKTVLSFSISFLSISEDNKFDEFVLDVEMDPGIRSPCCVGAIMMTSLSLLAELFEAAHNH
jgi:hypothetical protein